MADTVSVAVLYNQVGEEEYERMLRKARREADLRLPRHAAITTVAEQIHVLVTALQQAGFRADAVNVRDSFTELTRALQRDPPDVVFNLVEFFHDDPRLEAMVAGVYELLRIPYTGAGPLALMQCQKKSTAKDMLLANGIRTPRFRVFRHGPVPRRHGLRYPLIVKPVQEDASAGIDESSVVDAYGPLEERVRFIWKEFDQGALVEEFIEGRELHVPVLGNYPPRTLPVAEVDFSRLPPEMRTVLTFGAKWDPRHVAYQNVETRCPADLPVRLRAKVGRIAVSAVTVLGCRDYARVDLRVNPKGEVYVLEVNPNPDLAEGDVFMVAAHAAGMSTTQVLRKIIELAVRRTPRSA
jgi:D-alanine-D-alanine ligase